MLSTRLTTAALFVGINEYPRPNQLRGCVNDLAPLHDFLKRQRGLREECAQFLINKDATKRAIIEGLAWLADQDVDRAVFVYSGHGARVLDVSGDETDTKYDQAIVPVDFNRAGLILDDDLGLMFSAFPAKTKIILHLDSCYSAKADRGFADYLMYGECRARSIHRDRVSRALLEKTRENREMREVFGINRLDVMKGLPPRDVVLLSGCRDFETSADAKLGGRYRGAMSFFVQQSIKALGLGATYGQVVAEAQRLLAVNGFGQVPQISGPPEWLSAPIYS